MEYKKINKGGAISIPVKLRREMNIKNGDAVSIEVMEDGGFKIKPYGMRCIFCDGIDNVTAFKGKGICDECRNNLRGDNNGWNNGNA